MKATVPRRNTTDLLNVENKEGQGLLLCLLTENKALVMLSFGCRHGWVSGLLLSWVCASPSLRVIAEHTIQQRFNSITENTNCIPPLPFGEYPRLGIDNESSCCIAFSAWFLRRSG